MVAEAVLPPEIKLNTADLLSADQFSVNAVRIRVVVPVPDVAETCSHSGQLVRLHSPDAVTVMLEVLPLSLNNDTEVGLTEMDDESPSSSPHDVKPKQIVTAIMMVSKPIK